jgi:hypothetical protein
VRQASQQASHWPVVIAVPPAGPGVREARFEIADRRVVAATAVEDALSLGSHPFASIIRRELAEAGLIT